MIQTITYQKQTLQAIGNTDLLKGCSIAIVGARECSERGADLAKRGARFFVNQCLAIVSGGAGGIDSIALNAALAEGGSVIICCPQGLGTFNRRPWQTAIDEGRCLLLSQFTQSAEWTGKQALARNTLIMSIGYSVLIGECTTYGHGGTFDDIKKANQQGKKPWIRPYAPGKDPLAHKRLLDSGAVQPLVGKTASDQLSQLLPILLPSQQPHLRAY